MQQVIHVIQILLKTDKEHKKKIIYEFPLVVICCLSSEILYSVGNLLTYIMFALNERRMSQILKHTLFRHYTQLATEGTNTMKNLCEHHHHIHDNIGRNKA
jgi:hypothetical protein